MEAWEGGIILATVLVLLLKLTKLCQKARTKTENQEEVRRDSDVDDITQQLPSVYLVEDDFFIIDEPGRERRQSEDRIPPPPPYFTIANVSSPPPYEPPPSYNEIASESREISV